MPMPVLVPVSVSVLVAVAVPVLVAVVVVVFRTHPVDRSGPADPSEAALIRVRPGRSE